MADDLRAQVTALARVIDRALRRIADVETMLRQLCADIEAQTARRADDESEQTGDQSWLLLADPEQARGVLGDLLDWLSRVYLRYPGAALPSCWLWHPAVVEELRWLRQAHCDAYSPRDGSPAKVADWHDRQRPGVVRRIQVALRDCELSLHEQTRPAPAVPLSGSAHRIAEAWTASRTSPAPTPDELTEADQHDRAQHRRSHR